MKFLLFMTALPALALAGQLLSANPLYSLGKRQVLSCPANYVICGTGCILAGWTCCPSQEGGCPPTENCQILDNNEYGCCPIGEHCVGNGGVSTMTYYSTISATDTVTTYSVSSSSTEIAVSTSAIATQTATSVAAGSQTTATASATSSGPPIATYTGGAAAGNVWSNQQGALAAVALGMVALL